MAEAPTGLSGAPSKPAAPAPATPAATPAAAAAAPAAAASPDATPPAGDNWRASLAGGDTKELERLARFKTPADLFKSYRELEGKLSARQAAPAALPADATPEQVAEYRKSMGVPDTPEGYKIAAPKDYAMSPAEAGVLGEFAKAMHAKHMPPAAVAEATGFFFAQQAAIKQQANAADNAMRQQWNNEVRKELGSDYDMLMDAGKASLQREFADKGDELASILNARLPSGGRLGDNPFFTKLIIDRALDNGFGDRIEANSIEASGRGSIAEQRSKIEALMFTDPAAYDARQGELQRLIELQQSRGEIDERGRPVRRRRAA